jgi:polysaccharide export outer membrane protein
MTRASSLLAAVLVCSVAGCSNGPRFGESSEPMSVTKLAELPPPTGTDLAAASTPYHIGPFDKLNVSVFNVPELSGKFQADASAKISLPLVGTVDAAGLTPEELAQAIDARLRTYVKNPQVTVNLDETTSQVYTVDGQVGQPGSYPALGNITLMRAVANAKGAGEFARLDDVVVFRSVNGRKMAALYSLMAIRRGLYPDPKIYANDIVVVGDSKAKRMFQQFVQLFPLLTTPLVVGVERIP